MQSKLLFIFLITFASGAFAIGPVQAPIAPPDHVTDGGSGAVNACFGGCEKDNFQRNFNENPYETDLKYKEIMDPRLMKQQLPNDSGAVKEGQGA